MPRIKLEPNIVQPHASSLSHISWNVRVAQRRDVLWREGLVAELAAVVAGCELRHVSDEQWAGHVVNVARAVQAELAAQPAARVRWHGAGHFDAHGVAGALKNALDWLVGCTDLAYKPVVLINTSGRAVHPASRRSAHF